MIFFNTSYLTDTYIVSTLKMESVFKNTIFGGTMIVKSGIEKIFLKFLLVGDYIPHCSGKPIFFLVPVFMNFCIL